MDRRKFLFGAASTTIAPSAYGRSVGFVHKGDALVSIALPENFVRAERLERWDLRGPSLVAKTGVQFEPAPQARQASEIAVSGYSAAILQAG